MDFPQNSAQLWAGQLLQAARAARPPRWWWSQSKLSAGRALSLAASCYSLHFFHHMQTHSRSCGEGKKGRKQCTSVLPASTHGCLRGRKWGSPVDTVPRLGSAMPGSRGRTQTHSLDRQLTLNIVRSGGKSEEDTFYYLFFFLPNIFLVSLFVA